MHIKTYIAETNSEAMELLREDLGDNPIIISSKNTDDRNNIRIVGAVNFYAASPWLSNAGAKSNAQNSISTLKNATDALFKFLIMREDVFKSPRILITPPPEADKTIVASKLCPQAKLKHYTIKVISCDTQRASGTLSATDNPSLAMCNVSNSAKVADGLKPILPISLKNIIMPQTGSTILKQQNTEATQ